MKEWIDHVSDSITKTGKKAIKKTKDLNEISKINLAIADEEDKMSELFKRIGMKYYEQYAKKPSPDYIDLFKEVGSTQHKIDEFNEKMTLIKGIRICPQCGAKVEANAIFCWSCGVNIIQYHSKSSKG